MVTINVKLKFDKENLLFLDNSCAVDCREINYYKNEIPCHKEMSDGNEQNTEAFSCYCILKTEKDARYLFMLIAVYKYLI